MVPQIEIVLREGVDASSVQSWSTYKLISHIAFSHPIVNHPEATSSVESAGVIDGKEIKSSRRIEKVADIKERTSDSAASSLSVYRHFGDKHGNCPIGESTHKADNRFAFDSYQCRAGVLPGEQRFSRTLGRGGPALGTTESLNGGEIILFRLNNSSNSASLHF